MVVLHRFDYNRKKNPKNENPNKILLKKFLDSNKQQKGKGLPSDFVCIVRVAKASVCKVFDHSTLKVLTCKQMLQRLLIAIAQVKAGNASENLLN